MQLKSFAFYACLVLLAFESAPSLARTPSTPIGPIRESVLSLDGFTLALKHFSNPGKQPLLLIHGLAQNDRIWDSPIGRYRFAQILHAQGYDVWVGNLRGAGTEGFRSDTPPGPHHWTVDDYAINDMPALVDKVYRETGQKPWLIGHSLAAWVFTGYLGGIDYTLDGQVSADDEKSAVRQATVAGVITIAGVYNLAWEHSVENLLKDPIRSEEDFYHSNYELELLAKDRPLFWIIPRLPGLPLGWIGTVLGLQFDRIPLIGKKLTQAYSGLQSQIIKTPVFSMFYSPSNTNAEMVKKHVADGFEDLGPHLVEQLANAVNNHETTSYYHLERPLQAYRYSDVLKSLKLPILFMGGEKDRLASTHQIYNDGYLKTASLDKMFITVPNAGHLDILTGENSSEITIPAVVRFIEDHQR
ncbi:alpha/beta fold hydrolase [Bdellovibrionota bacterium FG-2]